MKRIAASIGIAPAPSVRAQNAGLFVSPGYGRHPVRVIDSCELIFVKSGVLGVFEGEAGYEVKGGQCIILKAGLRHGGTLDYAKGLQFYWMHFTLKKGRGPGELALPKVATLRRPERMVELFRRFLDDQEEPGEYAQLRASLLMELILLETLETGTGRSGGEAALLSEAEALIAARFHECDFSASKLAKALKCNPDYLNRLFKRHRGLTVTAAMQRRRIGRVAQMLLEPSGRSVEETALESGFSDHTYMRRLFKRLKGMTPRDYRKLHGRLRINTR